MRSDSGGFRTASYITELAAQQQFSKLGISRWTEACNQVLKLTPENIHCLVPE